MGEGGALGKEESGGPREGGTLGKKQGPWGTRRDPGEDATSYRIVQVIVNLMEVTDSLHH